MIIFRQFYDLLELFKVSGKPPDTNYLFLGDYINTGHFSVETISLLVCLMIRYPSRVFLLRGNHESRAMSEVYGFYSECIRKYGNSNVWNYFCDMFDYLPISAIIDNTLYCVHGGLSPSLLTLDNIRSINRFKDVPPEGPLTDLLWSEPDHHELGFKPNPHGAGYLFGYDVTDKFIRNNSLSHIIRSHSVCLDGYQVTFNNKLSTIWSAPNYTYRLNNLACVLEICENTTLFYNTFIEAPESERIILSPYEIKEVPDYYS